MGWPRRLLSFAMAHHREHSQRRPTRAPGQPLAGEFAVGVFGGGGFGFEFAEGCQFGDEGAMLLVEAGELGGAHSHERLATIITTPAINAGWILAPDDLLYEVHIRLPLKYPIFENPVYMHNCLKPN